MRSCSDSQTKMQRLCSTQTEEFAKKCLNVLLPLLTAGILLTATGNLVASAVLLYENLGTVFRQVLDDVEAQYTKPSIDFSSMEAKNVYKSLLRPKVYILFWHQLAIITNQLMLTISLACNSKFLKHASMLFMAVLATAEVIMETLWAKFIREAEHGNMIETLLQLVPSYRGANSTCLATLVFNYIQANFHCCGVYTFTEWFDPKLSWSRTINYGSNDYELRLPISCCSNITPTSVPNCALDCSTERPYPDGCAKQLSNMPLFRITWIPEESYNLVYLFLQLSTLSTYVTLTVLQERNKRKFRETRLIPMDGRDKVSTLS